MLCAAEHFLVISSLSSTHPRSFPHLVEQIVGSSSKASESDVARVSYPHSFGVAFGTSTYKVILKGPSGVAPLLS